MKILHCADLHLGVKNSKLPIDKMQILENEQIVATHNLFDEAIDDGYDIVIIVGDLFHKKSVSNKIVNSFFDAVERFNRPVLYTYGNHDEKFEFKNLPSNFIILNKDLPYYKLIDCTFYHNQIDLDMLENVYDAKDNNILLAHGNLINSRDNDYINLTEILNKKHFDYIALGHSHSFEKFEYLNNLAVYSGSLFSNGFDEIGDKGYVCVNIENKNIQLEFCPFAKRRYMKVQVDITDIDDFSKLFNKTISCMSDISKNDLVRIELTGYFNQDSEKYLSLLKEKLDDYFYVEIIDKSKIKIDLDSIKNEELSFKAEFLKLVNESEQDEMIKTKICMLGIEALKGDNLSL